VHPDRVGVAHAHADALGDRARGDVRVQVDEPGHDVPTRAADLQDADGLGRGDVRGDPRDLAVGDRDVQPPVQALAGVEDVAALDQQVIHQYSFF
jgi:hypothetical protein